MSIFSLKLEQENWILDYANIFPVTDKSTEVIGLMRWTLNQIQETHRFTQLATE